MDHYENKLVGSPKTATDNVQTVRDVLDEKIHYARRLVESTCVAKAKAEFLGLLDAPYSDLENIFF